MAGRLTLSTLNDDTGVLATQNGMTGIAKAWVKYSWNGSAVTIRGNFNISSVTRNSTGLYTFTFTTALPDANYAIATAQGLTPDNGTNIIPILEWNGSTDVPSTTTTFICRFVAPTTGGVFDPKVVGLIVNGN